ncbi:MAG: hypothetical protein ACREC5_05365 [Thermoplasmata archaeon]
MRLRAPAVESADPFSRVLALTLDFAGAAPGPFGEKDLWPHLAHHGISVTGTEGGPAEGAVAEEGGLFVAKVALDYLYARRELSRRLGGDGAYAYGRSG